MNINQILASANNVYTQALTAIAVALAIWNRAKIIITDLASFLLPLIQEVEQLAQDGKIDKDDRKKIVMEAVNQLQAKGVIKLNTFTKWMASLVVDKIAGTLPDYIITPQSENIIKEAADGLGVLAKGQQ